MTLKPFLLSLTCLAAFGACSPEIEKNDHSQVFFGGSIITMTDTTPQAIMVRGEEILAVGDLEDFRKSNPAAQYHDLSGKTLMPGVIDSHVHVRELGMDAVKADLVGVNDADEIVTRLKIHYPNPEPGMWLIGQGWDEGKFGSLGYPDRKALDDAFPDNPIKLESLHGFAGFYNGAALEIAGIDKDTPDPAGGNILHRENGEPTGVMLTLAQGLVNQHVPEISQRQREQAIKAGLEKMSKAGVSTIHEAGMTPGDVAAFIALAERGELPIRVYGLLDGNDKTLMTEWFARGILDDPKDRLDIRGIKVFYDGSLGSRTAMMHEPYSDEPDKARPTARITLADIDKLAIQAIDKNFQMAVHTIGDEANDCIMASYELRLADHPDFDHRWRLEHAQIVLPGFYENQARMGVIASMQPSHAVGDSDWAEDRVGPERIKHGYAWRTILDNGGHLIFNSDLPGEPWTPMETLYFAVTRKKLDGAAGTEWYPEQALSIEESLKAMTTANAYAGFQEDRLGSLEPGKWADFIILDKNPLSSTPDGLKDIQVVQTWVAGKRVY